MKINIENKYVIFAYREIDNTTMVRLPYLNEENFIPHYLDKRHPVNNQLFTPIPVGIDVLVKDKGENIGINLNRKLDGERFKAVFGLKLNNEWFLGLFPKYDKWKLINIEDISD